MPARRNYQVVFYVCPAKLFLKLQQPLLFFVIVTEHSQDLLEVCTMYQVCPDCHLLDFNGFFVVFN